MSCHTPGVECMSIINCHEIVANIPKSTEWACIEIAWCLHRNVRIIEQWQTVKNYISITILLLHLVADVHNLLFQQRDMFTSLVKIHFKIKQFVFWSFELLFRVLEFLAYCCSFLNSTILSNWASFSLFGSFTIKAQQFSISFSNNSFSNLSSLDTNNPCNLSFKFDSFSS